jgi:hypothetical protein
MNKKLRCYICGDKKLTSEFSRDNSKPHRCYRQSICKLCKTKKDKKRNRFHKKSSAAMIGVPSKKETLVQDAISKFKKMSLLMCGKCKMPRPREEFSNNSKNTSRGGKTHWCKKCHSEYNKERDRLSKLEMKKREISEKRKLARNAMIQAKNEIKPAITEKPVSFFEVIVKSEKPARKETPVWLL